eukprot:6384240-Amphidinium_carterae.1
MNLQAQILVAVPLAKHKLCSQRPVQNERVGQQQQSRGNGSKANDLLGMVMLSSWKISALLEPGALLYLFNQFEYKQLSNAKINAPVNLGDE